jgi:hypothetical protein
LRACDTEVSKEGCEAFCDEGLCPGPHHNPTAGGTLGGSFLTFVDMIENQHTDTERLRFLATRDASLAFCDIAARLRNRGHDSRRIAHFINRLVFCLFVESIDLLPRGVFSDILEQANKDAAVFRPMLGKVFSAMKDKGGPFATFHHPRFDGGLFDDDDNLPLAGFEISDLHKTAGLNWSLIEPLIFGTLFEAGLDPTAITGTKPAGGAGMVTGDKGVGIHYTDPATIMKIIEPVVLAPLRREWQAVKADIARHRDARDRARTAAGRTRAENAARAAWTGFRERLARFRVLDPACGSGNFLYLALLHLKDFDLEVLKEARGLDLPADDQRVGPEAVRGLEVNAYAAELARTTLWIGELQWQLRNGFGITRAPIPGRLDGIECRDALLGSDGTEADWPAADVVVGNPPFLGGKRLRTLLGGAYVDALFAAYRGRVPAEADLVAYWFVKAWQRITTGTLRTAGLVTTNSIRGGANRRVLDPIAAAGALFEAWDDEPWTVEGAAVRVSLIVFGDPASRGAVTLDGQPVKRIHADLTGSATDVSRANVLLENRGTSFQGVTKGGSFGISGATARKWLLRPSNPNGRLNSDVIRPIVSGREIVKRYSDHWVVDFGDMSEDDAALYDIPFEHIRSIVKMERKGNNRKLYEKYWWRFSERRPGMRAKSSGITRYIATPKISKHRIFVWLSCSVLPDNLVIAVMRSDDTTFGILHSAFHELWSLKKCSYVGVGNDPTYTPTTTFGTFPFPEGLTPNLPAAAYADDPRARAIAAAAQRLDALRCHWLNPPELVDVVPEVVPGFPDRMLPKGPKAEAELKTRTLTTLYNQRPAWLTNAHRDLDAAVAAAYGWPADISEEEALRRLLALNHARAAASPVVPTGPTDSEEDGDVPVIPDR